MDPAVDQSSSHAASSFKMSVQAGDRRFSYDVKRADPIPASYLDASIPLNLPPRRSMKMLKDGSDFVWPDSAHALFVQGLQAWKTLTIGSKRTRAPRGEGKTDFLVRFLQSRGVDRTKKQVASHLQVLRTEWRNLDNPVLLSLVDEAHARSMSEPSLPPLATESVSSSSPVFEDSPDPNDDSATPISISPHPNSPLRQAAHSDSNDPSQSLSVMSQSPTRIHSSPDVSTHWQSTNHPRPPWSSPHPTQAGTHRMTMARRHDIYLPNAHDVYHDTPYDSPISHHKYEGNAGSLTSPSQGYADTYYNTGPGLVPAGRQISLPLSEGGSSIYHLHPGLYHQNNNNTYVNQSRTHHNDYGLANYTIPPYVPNAAQAAQQARRPAYPDLANLSLTYGQPSNTNYHPDYNPSQNHQ